MKGKSMEIKLVYGLEDSTSVQYGSLLLAWGKQQQMA